MSVTTYAGADAALVFTFAGAVTGAAIVIEDAAGTDVVASTSTGLSHIGGGVYTYVWRVSTSQADGLYTATVSGTIAAAPVSDVVTVAVSDLPTYATLADLKVSAGEITSTDRDALLRSKLAAGARMVDRHCGRRFYRDSAATARTMRTSGRVVDGRDGQMLIVADIATTTGLIVEYSDTGSSWTAIASGDYEVVYGDPDAPDQWPITGLLLPYGTWSWRLARITAARGWPAVPAEVAESNLLQSSRLYNRKDSPQGVLGSAEWGVSRVARVDPDVAALLQPFQLPGVG